MHRDVVYTHPPNVEPLAHTTLCDVQAMYEKRRLISVQGHPEFDGDIITNIVQRRYDQGIFDEALYNDGIARAYNHHDGTIVAAAFIRFMLEE